MSTFFIVLGCLVVYVVASWVIVYNMMKDNAGPGGLGMLMIPFAPLFLPLSIVMIVFGLFRRMFRTIFR